MVGSVTGTLGAVFWTGYIVMPVLALVLLARANVLRNGPGLVTIVFAYYWLIAFFGYGLLFIGWSEYRATMGVVDPLLIAQCMGLSGLSLILMALGVLASSRLQQNRAVPSPATARPLNRTQLRIIGAMFVAIAVMTAVYIAAVPEIALVVLLKGGDAAAARSAMTNAFHGPLPFHYFQLAFQSVAAFCVYILVRHALVRRGASTWLAVSAVAAAVFAINVLDLQKAPSVWLATGIALTILFSISRKKQFVVALIGVPLILLLAFGIVAIVIGTSGRTAGDIARTLFDRLLVGGITPAYFYLDIVPTAVPFLDGSTLPNPRGILPWEPFPYTQFFHSYMNPLMHERGITGSAPTTFWAELYVNFGLAGIVVGAPLVGFVLGLGERIIDEYVSPLLRPAVLAWTSLHLMKLAESGISRYLLDEKLVVIVLLTIALMRAERSSRDSVHPPEHPLPRSRRVIPA